MQAHLKVQNDVSYLGESPGIVSVSLKEWPYLL